MDFGFRRYADDFWTSDNTDPFMRVFIQWGASQFYPACAMASHVTDSPNQLTKRVTSLKYRFDVSMTGRLGFELHPNTLSTEEVAFAKRAVADYKRIRPIVQQGDLYRLASPYENTYSSMMYVSESKAGAALFVLGSDEQGGREARIFPRGLDPALSYRVTEINRGARLHAGIDGKILSGRALMADGIAVSLEGAYDSASFEMRFAEE